MPHTNHNQLSESMFLMHAGHFQWTSISRMLGSPLSRLRTLEGGEVYGTYQYIEEDFPEGLPMNSFRVDDECVFVNLLRAFKNISVDGMSLFHRVADLPLRAVEEFAVNPSAWKGRAPYIRMANIFITPAGGNEHLKIAPPANVHFEKFPPLPIQENAYNIVRAVGNGEWFGTIRSDDIPFDRSDDFAPIYEINPDRDTNGAGLVYFANYFAFMDWAERKAMTENALRPFRPDQIEYRALRRREIAYFGNARLDDAVRIHVRMFRRGTREVGFRYRLERKSDGKLIAISESIKTLPE
jgi:probable biosynthetic protein (TIGR04098 family)